MAKRRKKKNIAARAASEIFNAATRAQTNPSIQDILAGTRRPGSPTLQEILGGGQASGFGGGGAFGPGSMVADATRVRSGGAPIGLIPGGTGGQPLFSGAGSSSSIGRVGGKPLFDLLGAIARGKNALVEANRTNRTKGGYAKGWQPGYSTRATQDNSNFARMMGGAGAMSGGDFISSLLAQAQGLVGPPPGELPFDPAEMAQRQFAPQYDLLRQLRTQATTRHNKAAADTQAMYEALANDIRQNAAQTAERYGVAEQNLDAAFGGAAENIQSRASESNREMADLMRSLGIQEAAPDVFANIEEERSRAINSTEGLGAVYKGTNEALSQSMQDYQQNTANTTGIAGANAKADIIAALGDVLAGYDNRELDLRGQQAQAENEYMLALQEMAQGAQSAYQSSVQDMLQTLLDQERWGSEFGLQQQEALWDRENQQAQRELDYAKWASEVEAATSSGAANVKDTINAIAAQMAPTPEIASSLVQGFMDAVTMGRPTEYGKEWTFEELLAAIDRRFPNSKYRPIFQQMAAAYWQGLGRK